MKLIIQVPCLNEEGTLLETLRSLPKSIEGVDQIEIQIINDGSTDNTEAVAREFGVDHILSFKQRRGLAHAFKAGAANALRLGADILVNTDADHQYRSDYIAKLIAPILQGEADVTIGTRPLRTHQEFSWLKKRLQLMGSWLIRRISKTSVEDAASGFRAYNQVALSHLNVYSEFSYTLETIIQAGYQNLGVKSVPIEVNPKQRPSRLFRNMPHYLWRSGNTILNVFLIYRSSLTFNVLAVGSFLLGVFLVGRYSYLVYFEGASRTAFWPSIVLAGSLLILSIQFFVSGVVSMLISSNRKLLEEAVMRLRRAEMQSHSSASVPTPQQKNAA